MKTLKTLRLPLILYFALFQWACVTGGDVVKVTVVRGGDYAGLKKEEIQKLDEIKKTKVKKGVDASLSNIIHETSNYTVSEYLLKYPSKVGKEALDYKVGGLDVLNIMVYEERDLSRKAVQVSGDGYISFPLIGRLMVDGLTTSEIEQLIAGRLAERQYVLDAHVSVMVTGYNSKKFLVLGAVNDPGSYPLQAQERVLDAISRAGGLRRTSRLYTEQAGAGKKGTIIRTENPNTVREKKIVINLDLDGLLKGKDQISNLPLTDKDMLYIPTAEHFYIMGEVKTPGSYQVPDREISLVEAISMAGGFTPIAARNKTRIIRVENGVEKVIEVKVDAITDTGKKIQDVMIQPNDVIVVPESFF